MSAIEWSRDGRAAFVLRAPPMAELWVAAPGEAAAAALYPDTSGDVFDCFWRRRGSTDELLVLRSETSDGRREAVLRAVDLATREVGDALVRCGPLTVREATLSNDGQRLALVGTTTPTRAPEGEPFDLWVAELATGELRCLGDGDAIIDRPTFTPDGDAIVCARLASRSLVGAAKRDLVVVDVARRFTRTLTREQPFSLGDGVNGFSEAIHALPDGSFATVTQRGLCDDVVVVTPSPDGLLPPAARFVDEGLRSWQRLRIAPCGRFVAIESGPARPERIVVGSVEDWVASPLDEPNGALAQRPLGEAARVAFRGRDGLALEGLLLTPRGGAGPWPTVVLLHGGSNGRQTARFNDGYAQAFVAAGFALFAPNLRGSAGYSPRFLQLNEGDFGGAELDDLDAAVDLLVARGIADPRRLYAVGHSYGGFLVELALTRSDRFAAAVASAAVSDWQRFALQSDLPLLAVVGLGDPADARDLFANRSPLTLAARVATPLFLIHGEKDRRVPLEQSRLMLAALHATGVPCDLLVEPREGHNFRDRMAVLRSIEATIGWCQGHAKQ
jgi:dipeptidyl aminopeptidase/acylaminoacyl peptidase